MADKMNKIEMANRSLAPAFNIASANNESKIVMVVEIPHLAELFEELPFTLSLLV